MSRTNSKPELQYGTAVTRKLTTGETIIEYRVPVEKRTWCNYADTFGLFVLGDLQKLGVPVKGLNVLEGVETGRLEISCSDDEYVYRWFPDCVIYRDAAREAAKKLVDPLNDDEDDEL